MAVIIRTVVMALALTVFAAAGALAEPEKIAEITVKGNRRIDASAILLAVKSKPGDTMDLDRVNDDLRAIYRLGHFQDVKAESETTDKGTTLIFVVEERPIVREIKIEGNKELSTDKVREVLEIKANTPFSPTDLTKSISKVKKLYADEGYYLAEVNGTTEKKSATEIRAVIKIDEGKKVLIKKIRFEGNKAFSDRELKGSRALFKGGVMETKEKWMFSWLTGAGTYKEEVLTNDVNLIADLYYNNGYVNVKVAEPQVTLLENKKGLLVTIRITEGDQYRTGSIDFRGDMVTDREELNKKLKMKTGEIFSRALLRSDVFTLTDFYADRGYAFANVTPYSKINQEKKTVDITFDLEKGEKVYIDRINISGNNKTRDKVIRRELRLVEGELYSSTGLKTSKQRVNNLGFFEEVNVATAKGSADNKLNLNVEVKEKPTGTFTIGAGYSSVDGVIGQGSVQQANFLGLGLRANASVSYGGKSQTYNFGLTDPYFLDSKWTLGGDIYRTEREYIDFTRRVTGGDVKAGYPLSDTMSTFWMYKFEDKVIFEESDAFKALQAQGLTTEKNSTTSSIYASITRNTTDYRLDPSSGMQNTASVEYAGLGGTNRFVRYLGETAVFFPLKWSSVFSLHGTLGYVQEIGKPIPIDEKFYLGGINTIRGYDPRTISPFEMVNIGTETEPNFTRAYLGGNKEAILNVELTFPLLKDVGLKGVGFFDAGNSYGEGSPMFSSFRMSYGGGIRWFSPIGPQIGRAHV